MIVLRYLLFCVVFIASALLSSHCGEKTDAASELVGTWITEDERYDSRDIAISGETVIFGTGTGVPNIYFIKKSKVALKNLNREYTLFCENSEGTEFRFIFHVEKTGDDIIMRLNNPRQVVWIKIPDADPDPSLPQSGTDDHSV